MSAIEPKIGKANKSSEKEKKNLIMTVRSLMPNYNTYGTIHYLAKKAAGTLPIISAANIGGLLKEGVLVAIQNNINVVEYNARLEVDGYEVHALPDSLKDLLFSYDNYLLSCSFDDIALKLALQTQQMMEYILEGHYPGYTVVCVDAVVRNTDVSRATIFRQLPLAHIDFSEHSFSETKKCFSQQWGEHFKRKGISYSSSKVTQILNIWMPLNTVGSVPLAIYPLSQPTLPAADYLGIRRDGSRFTPKVSVYDDTAKKKSSWCYFPYMPFGTAYVFKSMETPHSAFELPPEHNSQIPRRSCECRCLFFKKNEDEKIVKETALPNKVLMARS